MRRDEAIQFAPVELPEIPPREPSWLERMLDRLFAFLADLFKPLGEALAGSWWWLQWVVLGLVVLFALVLIVQLVLPGLSSRGKRRRSETAETEAWRPDAAASLALLEDADALAAEGRFDEATHLLLQRSVGQIAAARPDWARPSSTARELAALPALSEAARAAFGVIAERVERSLFALGALDHADWQAARTAYAEFAQVRIDPRAGSAT